MGFIYKVTNPNNNKCYIGKTTRNYKDRWAEHKRDRIKEPYKTWHFYRMLNKIGPENVIWEVIEEVPNDKIDEREQYWIAHYNSFKNGYNETSGGSKGTKYDYNEVLNYWLTEGNRDFAYTGKHFGANESTINYIIKSFGYKARTPQEVAKANAKDKNRPINQIDLNTGEVINTFYSCEIAAIEVFQDEKAARTIWAIANGSRPSYKGYGWQYASEIGQPIYLNKQIKNIVLPEYNKTFNNKMEAAQWFIENNLTRSKSIRQVEGAICYALSHSGKYQKIKIEEQEKVIYTYYKKEDNN